MRQFYYYGKQNKMLLYFHMIMSKNKLFDVIVPFVQFLNFCNFSFVAFNNFSSLHFAFNLIDFEAEKREKADGM